MQRNKKIWLGVLIGVLVIAGIWGIMSATKPDAQTSDASYGYSTPRPQPVRPWNCRWWFNNKCLLY